MMKFKCFVLLLLPMLVHALEPESIIPQLKKSIPLQINEQNRRNMIPHENDAKKNLERFQEKNFPVGTLIFLPSVILWGLAVWLYPLDDFRKKKFSVEPKEQALSALKKLKEESLSSKEWFDRLILIVRTYIENKFEVPATHQTTPEFLEEWEKDASVSPELRDMIREFLVKGDHVKFSKDSPKLEDREEAEEVAEVFFNTEITKA